MVTALGMRWSTQNVCVKIVRFLIEFSLERVLKLSLSNFSVTGPSG